MVSVSIHLYTLCFGVAQSYPVAQDTFCQQIVKSKFNTTHTSSLGQQLEGEGECMQYVRVAVTSTREETRRERERERGGTMRTVIALL